MSIISKELREQAKHYSDKQILNLALKRIDELRDEELNKIILTYGNNALAEFAINFLSTSDKREKIKDTLINKLYKTGNIRELLRADI